MPMLRKTLSLVHYSIVCIVVAHEAHEPLKNREIYNRFRFLLNRPAPHHTVNLSIGQASLTGAGLTDCLSPGAAAGLADHAG